MPRASGVFATPSVYVALMLACLLMVSESALITWRAWSGDGFGIVSCKRIGVGHLVSLLFFVR